MIQVAKVDSFLYEHRSSRGGKDTDSCLSSEEDSDTAPQGTATIHWLDPRGPIMCSFCLTDSIPIQSKFKGVHRIGRPSSCKLPATWIRPATRSPIVDRCCWGHCLHPHSSVLGLISGGHEKASCIDPFAWFQASIRSADFFDRSLYFSNPTSHHYCSPGSSRSRY